MKHLSRFDIEAIADKYVQAYMALPDVRNTQIYRIDPELLLEKVLGLNVEYQHLSYDGSILGMTSFTEMGVQVFEDDDNEAFFFLDGKTVLVEKDLNFDSKLKGRKNFTLMHEGSHQIFKEVLKMAFVNMFNDRVEQFNLREENERLAELFSDEKLQEEAQWQAYSVKEISRLFSISEEEALKLMNCGLFKTYRVGNEYRASKKSVEENKKIVKAVLTYQDKKTMSVPDVMRILGLGKTATYRLINQCRFKTYLVLGKMRVDVDSFEDWYAGQFHYEKVNGERPGKKYGKTLSPLTVAKVLGIPRSTANDLMNDGIVEFIWVDGKRRIKRESFDKWYASQSKYTKVKEIEEVEGYVD